MDLLALFDPEFITGWAEKLFSHQFTQMTMAFMAASWLHSGRVKKEIKAAFAGLTDAIDNVADKVTNELAGIKGEIKHLDGRVEYIEKTLGGNK